MLLNFFEIIFDSSKFKFFAGLLQQEGRFKARNLTLKSLTWLVQVPDIFQAILAEKSWKQLKKFFYINHRITLFRTRKKLLRGFGPALNRKFFHQLRLWSKGYNSWPFPVDAEQCRRQYVRWQLPCWRHKQTTPSNCKQYFYHSYKIHFIKQF